MPTTWGKGEHWLTLGKNYLNWFQSLCRRTRGQEQPNTLGKHEVCLAMETYRAVVTQKDPGSYENIGGTMHLWREDIYLVNEARLHRRTRKQTETALPMSYTNNNSRCITHLSTRMQTLRNTKTPFSFSANSSWVLMWWQAQDQDIRTPWKTYFLRHRASPI